MTPDQKQRAANRAREYLAVGDRVGYASAGKRRTTVASFSHWARNGETAFVTASGREVEAHAVWSVNGHLVDFKDGGKVPARVYRPGETPAQWERRHVLATNAERAAMVKP